MKYPRRSYLTDRTVIEDQNSDSQFCGSLRNLINGSTRGDQNEAVRGKPAVCRSLFQSFRPIIDLRFNREDMLYSKAAREISRCDLTSTERNKICISQIYCQALQFALWYPYSKCEFFNCGARYSMESVKYPNMSRGKGEAIRRQFRPLL